MKTKLTSFIMIILMLTALAAIAQAATPAGKVTNLEGRVDISTQGKPAMELLVGQTVHVGEIIRTKSKSKCEITWIDGSIARLAENTRLQVTEFNLGKTSRKSILSLFRGKVQNVVVSTTKLFGAQGKSVYEVHTPTSVCGVRGTTFFNYFENGVSGGLFAEGQGYMYGKGRPEARKEIPPGILMVVAERNATPKSKRAEPGELGRFFEATNLREKKKEDKKSEDEQGQKEKGGASDGGGGKASSDGGDKKSDDTPSGDGKAGDGAPPAPTASDPGTSDPGATGSGAPTGGDMLGGTPPAPTAGPSLIGGTDSKLVRTDAPGPIVEPTPVVPVTPVVETFPSVSMATNAVSPTQNNTANFTLSSDAKTPVTFEYNLNNAGWQSIEGNTLTLTDPLLAAGNNNILFRAKDANGNITKAEQYAQKTWTFYNLNVTTDVGQPTKSSTATFNLTSNTSAVTYEYQLNNSGIWVPIEGNTLQVAAPALIAGNNILQIRAKDQFGNVSLPVDYNQNAWVISDMLQNVTIGDVPGVLSGVFPAINLTASGDTGVFVSNINGPDATLYDGSIYDGYLAGIPGSWRGLFIALAKKDGVLSFLKGNLDGSYTNGSLTASGTLVREATGYTSTGSFGPLGGIYLPVVNSIYVGSSLYTSPHSGAVSGYLTAAGGPVGIWGITTTGYYSNEGRLSTWTTKMGAFDGLYAFLGDVQVTDDLAGHLSIVGDNLTYMDQKYLGNLGLQYRATYSSDNTYESIGTGTAIMQPLAFSGYWGGMGCLFSNEAGNYTWAASDPGIFGGLNPFWSGLDSSFLAMGNNMGNNGAFIPSKSHYLWNTTISGSLTERFSGEYNARLQGLTAGIWIPGATTTNNSAYALYWDYNGKGTPGLLISNNVNMTSHSDVNMWKAEGTFKPYPSGDQGGVYHPWYGAIMDTKLAGNFIVNNQPTGSILGYQSQDAIASSGTFYLTEYLTDGYENLSWGIYNLSLGSGNVFSGKPTGNAIWSAQLGGKGQFSDSNTGYWLANITNGNWTEDGQITASVSGVYLTPTYKGIIETSQFYGINSSEGAWIGQSVGNYQGQKLTFVSDLYPSLRYYDGSTWQSDPYSVSGLLGGIDSLWSSTVSMPVSLSIMGTETLYGTPASAGYIFNAETASQNFTAGDNTTYDGGAYQLFYGGSQLNTRIAANLAGLYIYDGKAGFLRGNLIGDVYSDINTWDASGSMYKQEIGATSITADKLQSNLWNGYMTGSLSSSVLGLFAVTAYTSTYTLYDQSSTDKWIMNGGIWQADFGGSYSQTIVAPWKATVGGSGIFGPYYNGSEFLPDSGYWLAGIADGTASDNNLSAGISGWYLTPHTMGTLDGNLIGTYGTTGNYWQAAAVGAYGNKQALAWSAIVNAGNWGYYKTTTGEEGFVADCGSCIQGLIGGISPLFGTVNADVMGLGTYYNRNQNSPLFTMLLVNAYDGPESNPFHVYYGGSWFPSGENHPEWFEGKMMGFYGKGWNGTNYAEVGLLTSGALIVDGQDSGYSVWGNLYPGVNMWNIPANAEQGRLASTKMTGTPASFSISESEWSPAAKVAGDLQGTMQMKTAHIDGIETWGIWMSAMGGSNFNIPEDKKWAARSGWKETNASGKPSYSLATLNGYYYTSDGAIWGAINGHFLNPDNMGIFTGDMVGVSFKDKNWQSMGLGSYQVTKSLSFSSSFSGQTYQTAKGTLNLNAYAQPGVDVQRGIFQGSGFRTEYFRAEGDTNGLLVKYGWQSERFDDRVYNENVTYFYYPNDSGQSLRIINGVPVEYQGPTSQAPVRPDFYQSPPQSPIVLRDGLDILTNNYPFSGSLSVDPSQRQFARVFSQQVDNFYTTVRLIPDPGNPLAPTFQGIMGGYAKDGDPGRTLWTSTMQNPMGLTFMGEHSSFTGPAVMTTGIGSSYNTTGTTPDGGAYWGFFTNNVSADRTTRGMYYGLYISPTGEAGFLQSTNIAGESSANLNMWEAEGDIYSVKVLDNISVPPTDLLSNMQYGAMSGNVQFGGAQGNFVSGGYLQQYAMGSGYTASINGYPCNGIFIQASSAGEYSNPEGSTNWQADFAGYGTFGYPDPGNIFSDYGIWHTNAGGREASWANNQIYAPINGEFLSYTKKGTLAGTFLGNYAETDTTTKSGIWAGTSSGVYQKTTNVAFSSGMAGKVFNNKLTKWISGVNNITGTSYGINGDPDNLPLERMYARKTISGATAEDWWSEIQYSDHGYVDEDNPLAYTKTTCKYKVSGVSITDQTLLESVPISNEDYLEEVAAMRSGAIQEYSGWSLNNGNFQGVFAGFNNLWYNLAHGQATAIEVAGLYTDRENTPGILTTGLTSFNPAVNMNPLFNSKSPIDGAYFAYLGAAFGKTTAAADTLDGLISGLYYDLNGKVGILYGDFTGSNLPDVGYFKGEGAIRGAYQLGYGVNGNSAANFGHKVIQSFQQWNYGINDVTIEGDNVRLAAINSNRAWINGCYLNSGSGFWGVVQNVTGGTKDASFAPTAWTWAAHQIYSSTPRSDYTGIEITGTKDGIGNGNFVGASAVYAGGNPSAPGFTAVSAGNIKGLFDPAATTWQALAQGAFMETNTFINLIKGLDAQQKQDFMAALKIPAISVGSVDLSGARTTVGNALSVTMAGVNFYAYSTGEKPKIFATNNVSGSYDVSQLGGAIPAPVNMTGSNGVNLTGVSATFTPKIWNNVNNAWGAQVNGQGAMTNPSTTINFTGGAAGSLMPNPAIPGTGNFGGTAAGVVK